jgi:filamentous hemagglutinin family protein
MSVNQIGKVGSWRANLKWTTTTLTLGLVPLGIAVFTVPALAQIIPDNTLGSENSQIIPNVNVRGLPAERIDGGAVRGSALFHSFSEFNVNEGQRVYFSNPAGIADIFSRVTGSNVSNILGRLGVDGGANLFLLNPNGILFGPNAQLDIQGSFVASTGRGFKFSDGSEFSATNPQAAPLLTMSVTPGVQYGTTESGATITNRGNLSVGEDLTLAGGNLDLQGQLQVGRDLTLFAQDTVKVRDSVTNPFIASAGGKLEVQGNQGVDIFALNHPNSGLFSGKDMVLRSANTVRGDAHYWSGGNFRIETLDSNLGNLFSPDDPVIRASGDVSLGGYTGASLHILAGGSVTITGGVTITGADPTNGLVENVTLSDGTIVAINGKTQPTLDIRAGTTAFGTPGTIGTSTPTSANITIGTITNPGGMVFLTNQYQPNLNLTGGDINVSTRIVTPFYTQFSLNDINTFNWTGGGGSIIIDARRDITTGNLYSITASEKENGGAITLIAGRYISTQKLSSASNAVYFNRSSNTVYGGNGGAISLKAGGYIETKELDASSLGGNGGTITLDAGGYIKIDEYISTSSLNSGDIGGGAISLTAGGYITTGDLFSVSSRLQSKDVGAGGDITVFTTNGNISLGKVNSYSYSQAGNSGDGGAITVSTTNGNISLKGDLNSFSYSKVGSSGTGGEIYLSTKNGNIVGESFTADDKKERFPLLNSFSVSEPGTAGNGGKVTLEARNTVSNLEILTLSSSSEAGAVDVKGLGDLSLTDTKIITSKPLTLNIRQVGLITLDVGKTGQSGDVAVTSLGNLTFNNSQILSDTKGSDPAGNVTITSPGLVTFNNSQIISNTTNTGQAGSITVKAPELRLDANSTLSAKTSSSGRAGDVNLQPYTGGQTLSAFFQDGAEISASSTNSGPGGNIRVTAPQSVTLSGNGSLSATTSSSGQAGTVTITTPTLNINGGAKVSTTTTSTANDAGKGGDITVRANTLNLSGTGSGLFAETQGVANAGNLTLNPYSGNDLQVNFAQGAKVSASTSGSGRGGSLKVTARNSVMLRGNGQLSAEATQGGNAGGVTINTQQLSIEQGAQVAASSKNGSGTAGDVDITASTVTLNNGKVTAETDAGGSSKPANITLRNVNTLNLSNNSSISASTQTGQAGSVNLNQGQNPATSVTLNNSNISAQADKVGGNAGGVTLNTSQLRLDNGAEISASNVNSNKGGDINLQGLQTLQVNNSRISSSTNTGKAGNVSINADEVTLDGTFSFKEGKQGGVLAQATGEGGNAGSVTLNSAQLRLDNGAEISASNISGTSQDITLQGLNTLSLSNGSKISASTQTGQAGSVKLNQGQNPATSVTLNNSRISAQATGEKGNAGDVTLNTSRLTLENQAQILASNISGTSGGNINLQKLQTLQVSDSLISTSTQSGKAGSVTVEATESVKLSGTFTDENNNSRGGILAEATNGGSAGDVKITTRQLSVRDRAAVAVSSTGNGTAGKLTVSAPEVILDNSARLAATTQAGSGGDIQLQNLSSLRLNNNSEISASTQNGQGGSLSVNAPGGTVALTDKSSIKAEATQGGNAGNVTINTNQLSLQDHSQVATSSQNGSGTAGDVNISARTVTLNQGGKITAQTDAGGSTNPADITLQGLNTLQLSGDSEISASTNTGQAGSITINTLDNPAASVTLDRSRLSVQATQEGGNAGSITMYTNSLALRNRSQIIADTKGNQEGANITLQGLDWLILRNGSLISANAGETANGGNIKIGANFIIAVPKENSDITANAFKGRGGNIDITTQGMFGIKFRPKLTPYSDITASSESGLTGTVAISTPNVDPSQGLTALPIDLIDPSNQITRSCGVDANRQNQFVVTGRGGLPPSPDDLQTSGAITPGWVIREGTRTGLGAATVEPPTRTTTTPGVEAQVMMLSAQGDRVLTPQSASATPHPSGFPDILCTLTKN